MKSQLLFALALLVQEISLKDQLHMLGVMVLQENGPCSPKSMVSLRTECLLRTAGVPRHLGRH